MFSRVLVVSLAVAGVGQARGPLQADWDWLNSHRTDAFDRLMPVASAPRQFVAYRSYRDLYQDVPESHFSISFADGPTLSLAKVLATTTVPVGRSVQQQLLDMHMGDREASLETLLPRVAIQRAAITELQCPTLKSRVDALLRTSIAIPKQSVIRLHGFQHRIVIDLGGIQVDATLDDAENDVIQWAVGTSNALRKCMNERPANIGLQPSADLPSTK
jgi:hypothetical protein